MMAEAEEDLPSRQRRKKVSWAWCRVGALMLLVLVGLTGPLWVFSLASCTSMRPCRIGQMLSYVEASCTEGSGARSQELLHGEFCTLVCDDPRKVPTIPQMQCLDGVANSSIAIQCVVPPEPPGELPTEPILASNAITEGDERLVCEQAQSFICEAAAGATSILIQLSSLTKDKCDDVFEECRTLNPVFTFQEFVRSPQALAYEADPTNITKFEAYLANPGTCTLGCFTELFRMDQLQEMQSELAAATAAAPSQVFQMADGQFSTMNFCGDNAGPACIRVRGLCSVDQDGDFYKHPTCVAGQAQWAQVDASFRIRYDGDERNGQAGKWLLETGMLDLLSSGYGTEIARQPTFNPTPALGDQIWNLKCRFPSAGGTGEYIQYRTKIVELVPCTCDSVIDCGGRGEAIGTKETGPNCRCQCEPDRAGDACEIPLCQVPGVLNGKQPACKEGGWIYPGGTCTPDCEEGFAPNHEVFTCDSEGAFLLPVGFQCLEVPVEAPPVDEFGNTPDAYTSSTTTPLPECTDFDCVFHGEATKNRREDGSCECICDEGFTGPQCRSIMGDCLAPLHKNIPNSALSTCEEGSRPSLICTARCAETYYPVPAVLECQGNELVPNVFRCFGGPTTQVLWCEMAQTISLVFSGMTALGLCVACVCFQRDRIRSFNNILYHDKLFEAQQDVHGHFNVVRMTNGQEFHSKLPDHLLAMDMRPAPQEDALHDAVGESNWANWGQPAVDDPMATQLPVQDLREDTSTQTPPSMPSTQRPSLHDAGVPGQVPDALAIVADPGLRRGGEVVLRYIAGRPELDGAHGWLLDFSHETGLCEVDLEGIEILKDIPIQCLEDALIAAEQPQALASSAPGPSMLDTNWLVQKRDLENKVEASRQERYKKFASEATKEETEKAARIKAALLQTEAIREDLEERLRLGLRTGDAPLLRTAIAETKELLQQKYLAIAPPASLGSLKRVLETAESRLEQFDAIQESRQRAQDYEERVRTGKAADWKMTSEELSRYVLECNPERVQAGLKAQLPVFLRSRDGQRFTILHDACREACLDEPGSEKATNRVEVVRLLCEARANKNAVDMKDRTPLDLALEVGGPRAKRHPTVRKLKALGLRTAAQAAKEARGEKVEESEEEPEEPPPKKEPEEPLIVPTHVDAEPTELPLEEPSGPRSFAPPTPVPEAESSSRAG